MGSFHLAHPVFSSVFPTVFYTLLSLFTAYHFILIYKYYDYVIFHCIDIIYLTRLSFLFLILIQYT